VQVKGHELTTRGELLKDEATTHAKMNIANSTGRTVRTHHNRQMETPDILIFTGEYLLNAKILNDLVQSEEREILWRASAPE
jgi:hypothetical protein